MPYLVLETVVKQYTPSPVPRSDLVRNSDAAAVQAHETKVNCKATVPRTTMRSDVTSGSQRRKHRHLREARNRFHYPKGAWANGPIPLDPFVREANVKRAPVASITMRISGGHEKLKLVVLQRCECLGADVLPGCFDVGNKWEASRIVPGPRAQAPNEERGALIALRCARSMPSDVGGYGIAYPLGGFGAEVLSGSFQDALNARYARVNYRLRRSHRIVAASSGSAAATTGTTRSTLVGRSRCLLQIATA